MIWLYVSLGILSIVLIATISMLFRVTNMIITSNFDTRYDDRHTLKYFTVDDFENLQTEPLEFTSDKGQKLRGYLYSSTLVEEKDYLALMVVSHGLGAGHLQYTTEINYFAQKGYLVFAFDDTGCNMSEGDKINGVTQGLIDLDYALRYIKSDERLNKMPCVLFGHSMGAFAVSNVTSINDYPIKGIASLAPFKDEPSMLYEQFRASTNLRYKGVLRILRRKYAKRFPKEILAINTLSSLEKSDIPHMIVAGTEDPVVDFYDNFKQMEELFGNKENYKFLAVEGRFHRPNLSQAAADYDNETNNELSGYNMEFKGNVPKEKIDEFYGKLDYHLLVEMDEDVMNQISDFYASCLKN